MNTIKYIRHLFFTYNFKDIFYQDFLFFSDQAFKLCAMKNGDDCVRFKDSYHSNGAVIMDNHPLMIMAREEQRNLLRHPLCLSLGKGTRLLGWTTSPILMPASISMLWYKTLFCRSSLCCHQTSVWNQLTENSQKE